MKMAVRLLQVQQWVQILLLPWDRLCLATGYHWHGNLLL